MLNTTVEERGTTVRAFEFHGSRREEIAADGALEAFRNPDRVCWVDILGRRDTVEAFIVKIANDEAGLLEGLDPTRAARSEVDPTDRPPKAKAFHKFVFARMYRLDARFDRDQDEVELIAQEIHVIAAPTFAITLRYPCLAWDIDKLADGVQKEPYGKEAPGLDVGRLADAISDFRERIPLGDPKNVFGLEVGAVLVDSVVDSLFETVGDLRRASEAAEERVLARKWLWNRKAWPGMDRRILGLHRMLRKVRWAFLPADEIEELTSGPFLTAQFDKGIEFRMRDLVRESRRAVTAVHDVISEVEQTVALRDSMKADRIGHTSYILTAVATVILIPTLIAGIYGMNFREMPGVERDVGFWTALIGMILLGIAVWMVIRWILRRDVRPQPDVESKPASR